jgi:hypothetical protein
MFLIVDYGGMLILTARGRLTPEVTSPVDTATMVFFSCLVNIYHLSCTISTLLAFLILPKMAERPFRPLGGRVRPQVKSQFDSLALIWYRLAFKFLDYLLPVKSYSTFSICMQNAL